MARRLLAAAATVLVLAGCSSADAGTTAAPTATGAATEAADAADLVARQGLTGMDATQIVDHLDRLSLTDRPTDLMASVRPDELLLTDGTQELTLDLPEDRYYLSVAPYVDRTHDCFHHSLTTCTGELADEAVDVRIVDDATGEVLVEEQVTTWDNGFVGFWLPRDVEGTVEVTADGLTGTAPFSTADDDGATCLTTLRLA